MLEELLFAACLLAVSPLAKMTVSLRLKEARGKSAGPVHLKGTQLEIMKTKYHHRPSN